MNISLFFSFTVIFTKKIQEFSGKSPGKSRYAIPNAYVQESVSHNYDFVVVGHYFIFINNKYASHIDE